MKPPYHHVFPFLAVSLLVAACGQSSTTPSVPCTDEELWDHVAEECVAKYRDFVEEDAGTADANVGDAGGDEDAAEPVDAGEADAGDPIEPECDKDRDGEPSIECGGRDCDDNDILRSPNVPELCDEVDNDCDGVNNEGQNCWFYAHSSETVYIIDPFEMTLTTVSEDAPRLRDIDTHPNGALLGVSASSLWEYDEIRGYWWEVGEFGRNVDDPNGFAIDSTGTAFVTSQDEIYTVDIVEGGATLLGNLGQDYYSSGDCVVNKRDSLYMTSKHDPEQDYLLLVNRENGSATSVGPIGFENVYALTAAWGRLYGMTDKGELIDIDPNTGAGTLLHTFPDVRFFGSASTPSR